MNLLCSISGSGSGFCSVALLQRSYSTTTGLRMRWRKQQQKMAQTLSGLRQGRLLLMLALMLLPLACSGPELAVSERICSMSIDCVQASVDACNKVQGGDGVRL
jgi:hypothetical protein